MASFGGQTPISFVSLSQRYGSGVSSGTIYTCPAGRYSEFEFIALAGGGLAMTVSIARSGISSTVIGSGNSVFINVKIRLSPGDSITFTKDPTNTNDIHANALEFNTP